MHSVSVHLHASQFLAGWREKAGRLFVPALSEAHIGDQVAIRVGIHGHGIRATLFGKVGLVRRLGRPALPPGVELRLDKDSLAAAGFLAMAARGERVTFREREPRFSVRRALEVVHVGTRLEVTTLNVSRGGCAVLWPGPLPTAGDEVAIRLERALFTRSCRAIVCWNQAGAGTDGTVGLKIASAGRASRAWRKLVESLCRPASLRIGA